MTGAAAGIGRAMALRFSRAGMNVVVADIDADGADAVAGEIGENALAVQADVTDPDSVEALAEAAYARFGSVELVCNNAGVLGRILPSWEQPAENWRWVFDVNVHGVVNGVRAFVPRMIAQDSDAYVLNTGSIAGMITGPFFAAYNASKHAVVALSECLHHELRQTGSKVRVGVLCPGWVNTGLADLDSKLPESLKDVNQALKASAAAAERDRGVRRMVADSISPEEIADIVHDAVLEDRFYIFPHPERKADVEARMRDILDEAVPEFPPKKR